MMNQYPLLAAGCAAVMALAMVVMRWPRTTWGIGLGLCAGAVWMVESRGLVVAPLVLGAVAIGGSRGRARHPWRLAVVVGVSFLLCALARAELASAQRRSIRYACRWSASPAPASPPMSTSTHGAIYIETVSSVTVTALLMLRCPAISTCGILSQLYFGGQIHNIERSGALAARVGPL